MKDKIRNSFNRAYKTYDLACAFQDRVCCSLIDMLNTLLGSGMSILDLGCGTGNSTVFLTRNFSYNHIFAMDIAINLLGRAQLKLRDKNVHFVCADFEETVFKPNYFDLVFSNMALQWSLSLDFAIKNVYQLIREGGILAFSIPIEGTFCELPFNSRNKFNQLSEIEKILTSCKFKIISLTAKPYILQFPSATAAFQSIKKVGANCCLGNRVDVKSARILVAENLCRQLTYNIAYIVAIKDTSNGA